MVRAFHAAAGERPQPETTQKLLEAMARHLMDIEEQDAAAAKRFQDYEPD
jgi:hypothetical protein